MFSSTACSLHSSKYLFELKMPKYDACRINHMQSCGSEYCDNYIVQLISYIVFVCRYIMQFYRQF